MVRTIVGAALGCFMIVGGSGAIAQDRPSTSDARTTTKSTAPLNLNTATVAQLEALPGVGPKVAQRIKEYRDKNGQFKKTEDLMNVKGIGEKAFLRLRPLVTVSPTKAGEPGQGEARSVELSLGSLSRARAC
ncbi:MAG: helix-hairpin-helix domain-containing protein [Vicinamibacterales bacterium]